MYVDAEKVRQDAFIYSHIAVNPVKRRRRRSEVQQRERQYEATYTVSDINVVNKCLIMF